MAMKSCMRCGSLMDEFDTECPCEEESALWWEEVDEHRGSRPLDEDLPERARKAGV